MPQISLLLGQVIHSSQVKSLNNKTFAPISNSTFMEVIFNSNIIKKHQYFVTLVSSNYKFKYSGNYNNNNIEQEYTSSRTGMGSGYRKLSLLYGYLFIDKPKIKVTSLFGPNINYLGKKGLWGKSKSEMTDSTNSYITKTVVQDSILKIKSIGLGLIIGTNINYRICKSNRVYLNFRILYNYGFNNLYEIHTKTITNGNLYDESKITGNTSGIFISSGITFNLKNR